MSIPSRIERKLELASGIEPYVGGLTRAQAARQLGVRPDEIIKLSSNENPLGPSPAALQALRTSAEAAAEYPTSIAVELHKAISEYLGGVHHEQITSGPGSSSIMHTLITACTEADGDVVWVAPGFTIYQEIAQMHGRTATAVETAAPDFELNPSTLIEAISPRTQLIFITRPNNPTSVLVPLETLVPIIEAAKDVGAIVVSDEAYVEFADDPAESAITLLVSEPDRYSNLIVSRTFSKAFALANVRLGYMVAEKNVARLLNATNAKWPTGEIARAAGLAALSDSEHLAKTKEAVAHGRRQLIAGLAQHGLDVVAQPQGNYLMVDVSRSGLSAEVFAERVLLEGKILIRGDFSDTYLRVSVGTARENERFLSAVARILSL